MKYSQYSRIAHHAISTGTFTISSSDDFTDGTWAASDLVDRELGIQLSDKKAFIRIGDEIREIMLDGETTNGDLIIPVVDSDVTVKKYEDFTTLLLDFSIVGEIDSTSYCATYRTAYRYDGTVEHIGDVQLTEWFNSDKRVPFKIVTDTSTVSIVLDASIVPNSTWTVRLNSIKN